MPVYQAVVLGSSLVGAMLVLGPTSGLADDLSFVRNAAVETDSSRPVNVRSPAALAFALRYSSVGPRTASADRWLARDKAKHVVGAALWTLSSQYILVQKSGRTEREGLPMSIGSGAAIGIAKEVYDASRPDRVASGRDLVADAVGIGVAVGIILL